MRDSTLVRVTEYHVFLLSAGFRAFMDVRNRLTRRRKRNRMTDRFVSLVERGIVEPVFRSTKKPHVTDRPTTTAPRALSDSEEDDGAEDDDEEVI